MLRTTLLSVLALALLGAEGGAPSDAGTPDAGQPDAGAARVVPVGPRASWVHADGGFFTDAGVSDLVVVPVGGAQKVTFPQPIISGHCDDQSLLTIDGTEDSLIFRGVAPGHTHCGFWFHQQPFPNRYVGVTVVPAR